MQNQRIGSGTNRGRKRVWRACLTGLLCVANAAFGHDLWLEADPPVTGTAKPEERALHLRLGENYVVEEEKTLSKEIVSRFDVLVDRTGRGDLLGPGQEGQFPVAKLRPEAGACLVVMDRKGRQITMDQEKFNRYLTEEGLDAVAAQRARLGQADAEGHDSYTRYLKALVPGTDPTGTLPNTLYKRRVGQRLEILFQNNPARLSASRKLSVKVTFEDQPLAGAKVFAYRREVGGAANGTALTATTNAQGLADFKLDQNGPWLVRLVHMRAGSERRTNPNGAWESFWGSYSFVARDAPAAIAPTAGRTVGGAAPDERRE